MRTQFSETQLSDPHLADAERSLRACMHCGICTATCPTYVLLGDERDGPRGRIVMMQEMLETGSVSADTVVHVDRCLSCLACRTACPSGVDYQRLVDTARAHIETHYRRPLRERLMRWLVSATMTRPGYVRAGLVLARVSAPLARFMPGRLAAMARKGAALRVGRTGTAVSLSQRSTKQVAVLPGCVQSAVAPEIDEALGRILGRRAIGLTKLTEAGCCGALDHHLGRAGEAKARARRVIAVVENIERQWPVEAITMTATGCVAHIADYPNLFRGDPEWQGRARSLAEKFKDASCLVEALPPVPSIEGPALPSLRIAFQLACSARNTAAKTGNPERLLEMAGFKVVVVPEDHLCCGSAGSYSLLQPRISAELRVRKLQNIAAVRPDIVASGNIGCLIQLSTPEGPPVVHYLELLDWAEGGPLPRAMTQR